MLQFILGVSFRTDCKSLFRSLGVLNLPSLYLILSVYVRSILVISFPQITVFMITLPDGDIFLELDNANTKQPVNQLLNWVKYFTTSYQDKLNVQVIMNLKSLLLDLFVHDIIREFIIYFKCHRNFML